MIPALGIEQPTNVALRVNMCRSDASAMPPFRKASGGGARAGQ